MKVFPDSEPTCFKRNHSHMKIFADGSYTIIVMSNYDSPEADALNYEITRLLAR